MIVRALQVVHTLVRETGRGGNVEDSVGGVGPTSGGVANFRSLPRDQLRNGLLLAAGLIGIGPFLLSELGGVAPRSSYAVQCFLGLICLLGAIVLTAVSPNRNRPRNPLVAFSWLALGVSLSVTLISGGLQIGETKSQPVTQFSVSTPEDFSAWDGASVWFPPTLLIDAEQRREFIVFGVDPKAKKDLRFTATLQGARVGDEKMQIRDISGSCGAASTHSSGENIIAMSCQVLPGEDRQPVEPIASIFGSNAPVVLEIERPSPELVAATESRAEPAVTELRATATSSTVPLEGERGVAWIEEKRLQNSTADVFEGSGSVDGRVPSLEPSIAFLFGEEQQVDNTSVNDRAELISDRLVMNYGTEITQSTWTTAARARMVQQGRAFSFISTFASVLLGSSLTLTLTRPQ